MWKSKHSEQSSLYVKNIRRKKADKCHYCGVASINRTCDKCQKRHSEYRKNRYASFKKDGVCVECGANRAGDTLVCKKHLLMTVSKSCFGTTKEWVFLNELFESQNGKCFYTGIQIFLGVNASLDHKIPKSKKTQDINYKTNLVWCCKQVNTCKNGLTDQEFIEMCEKVHKNFSGEPVERRRLRRAMKQETSTSR